MDAEQAIRDAGAKFSQGYAAYKAAQSSSGKSSQEGKKMAQYDENGVDVNYPYATRAESTKAATNGWSTFNNMSSSQQAAQTAKWAGTNVSTTRAPASRSAPTASTGAEHLNSTQFSMLPGGFGQKLPVAETRSTAHAGTSMHPGGFGQRQTYQVTGKRDPLSGKLEMSKPTITTRSARVQAADAAAKKPAPKRGGGLAGKVAGKIGAKLGLGGEGKKGKVRLPGPSKHAGKNAQHLQALTK